MVYHDYNMEELEHLTTDNVEKDLEFFSKKSMKIIWD